MQQLYVTNTNDLSRINLRLLLYYFPFCSFLLSFLVPIYGYFMTGMTVRKKELLGNSFTSCITVTFLAKKKEEEKGTCTLAHQVRRHRIEYRCRFFETLSIHCLLARQRNSHPLLPGVPFSGIAITTYTPPFLEAHLL